MKSLKEIYENYKGVDGWGDKGTAHTYIDEYEKILQQYRKNSTILEIGIAYGHSLEMWCDYFIDSTIIGVDLINHDIPKENRYKSIFCDATSPSIIPYIQDYKLDVIIDDGSHLFEHQISSFNLLKEFINPGGLYIIEDIIDIDYHRDSFESLHNNCKIVDNRHIKGRSDDVLVIYQF
jgi:cephalosporin hydroxylase